MAAIRQHGGRAIAQDEESSAVFGMPRAAVEAGAETTLPISGVARVLRRLAAVSGPGVSDSLERLAGRDQSATPGSRSSRPSSTLSRPPCDGSIPPWMPRGSSRQGAASDALRARLIDEVTINETFFFRQRRELDAIDWRGLHQAARAAGSDTVRVWVAACASGEEAYTLALLATRAFAPLPPPVSILGTDISEGVLDRARLGRYGRRALRMLDAETRKRHFLPVERRRGRRGCAAEPGGVQAAQPGRWTRRPPPPAGPST